MKNKNSNLDSASDRHSEYIELLMANTDSLCRYIVAMVPNAADADDILQETSKLIWQKFDSFQRGTSFKNWAITIARYKVLNYYRRQKSSKVTFSSQTIDAISDYLEEHKDDSNRDLELLHGCFAKLATRDRELIRQRYSKKITTKQLAIQFGRSISGLYSSLARIQRMLVDCVQRQLAKER